MSIDAATAADFRQAATAMRERRKQAHRKKTLTIRVKPETIEQARELLGEGYTGVLRRLIVKALDHPEMLKDCL